jgi:hypothetical protein
MAVLRLVKIVVTGQKGRAVLPGLLLWLSQVSLSPTSLGKPLPLFM